MDALSSRIDVAMRHVDDFPTIGVRFVDIGPVIADAGLLAEIIDALAAPFRDKGVTHVLGLEARGLYFAGGVAVKLGAGMVPVRKPGKLPPPRLSARGQLRDQAQVVGAGLVGGGPNTYVKTYEFEIGEGLLGPGVRALVIDDLLAKGGSIHACRSLVEQSGASIVGAAVVVELGKLDGRANLDGIELVSLLRY